MSEPTLACAIFLFDEVEVLDFAGPFEVLSTASRMAGRNQPDAPPPFRVFTVAAADLITARGGLRTLPDFTLDNHPAIDVLIVPGGVVSAEMEKPAIIEWIRAQVSQTRLTASVCTGAFLLGKADLLHGRRATTHWEDVADLRALLPDTTVVADQRWIDEGNVVTAAGISAGLDMSLHLVARFTNHALAVQTARQMDYDWQQSGQ